MLKKPLLSTFRFASLLLLRSLFKPAPAATPAPAKVEGRKSNKANRCYESISRFTLKCFVVRVWRTEKELGATSVDDLLFAAKSVYRSTTASAVFRAFERLPNIAAIEVLDGQTGNGSILYPDWK